MLVGHRTDTFVFFFQTALVTCEEAVVRLGGLFIQNGLVEASKAAIARYGGGWSSANQEQTGEKAVSGRARRLSSCTKTTSRAMSEALGMNVSIHVT